MSRLVTSLLALQLRVCSLLRSFHKQMDAGRKRGATSAYRKHRADLQS